MEPDRSLTDRFAGPPWVTRFAPSPTGFLHLGHVISAAMVWALGRRMGARILLRIEDHDRGRSRPEFEESILTDLEWLGFAWDAGVTPGGAPSAYRQSDHPDRFARALEQLRATGRVYRCRCSRRMIQDAMGDGPHEELVYPGTCRDAEVEADTPHGLRLRLDPGPVLFEDALLGPQQQDPSRQCGDVLLVDRDGQWTYQFAVVVDDLEEGVNLVIRGEDILRSTGRQIRLAEYLGRSRPPLFAHHGLLLEPDGRKLSKRGRSESISSRRDAGESPPVVLGRAAHQAGWIPTERAIDLDELTGLIADRVPAAV